MLHRRAVGSRRPVPGPRPGLAALLGVLLALSPLLGPVGPAEAALPAVVLDTLAPATTATRFDAIGAGGQSVQTHQNTGPRFTLTQSTVLTEIGAFLNNCGGIVGGVPNCPNTHPLTVQVRPALNGAPDPDRVLASFVLSHDADPLVFAYESVAISLPLGPGTYFALFSAQGDEGGTLMDNATSPFDYTAGPVTLGFLDTTTGQASLSGPGLHAAVRILAAPPIATGVLDDFNRADGALGPNWTGATDTGTFRIAANRLQVRNSGYVVWSRAAFGPDQEARLTLRRVSRGAAEQDLLLKVNGIAPTGGTGGNDFSAIEVEYDARQGEILVNSHVPFTPARPQWVTHARFPFQLGDGDQLGARALADGRVQVFARGGLVGETNLTVGPNPFPARLAAGGGQLGIWVIGATAADPSVMDDFGGGDAAG